MSSRRDTALVALMLVVFFTIRFALLVVREPFFDELFTVWLAGKPFRELWGILQLDSGPPLYYVIARMREVFALRLLSLLFATTTLALLVMRPSLGRARYIAAALLAVYPPAALFAVDARAYALCGLFVAAGVIAIHEERPFVASGAFLLAAYSHWYGALYLPLVLLTRPRRRALAAFAAGAALFVPGALLALRQPAEATRWFLDAHPLAALGAVAFAGRSAEALFAPAPLVLVVVSALALLIAGARAWAFVPMVLIPIALALASSLAGRTVYFPMRFEAVLAVPLVLWIATSLERWSFRTRSALTAILLACGLGASAIGIVDHFQRPLDPYREAALALRSAPPAEPIVASGYLYLEAVHQLGERRVRPWPLEQGRHPGWRVSGAPSEPLPVGGFIWIGERGAPELPRLRRRRVTPLFANGRAVILRVAPGLS